MKRVDRGNVFEIFRLAFREINSFFCEELKRSSIDRLRLKPCTFENEIWCLQRVANGRRHRSPAGVMLIEEENAKRFFVLVPRVFSRGAIDHFLADVLGLI